MNVRFKMALVVFSSLVTCHLSRAQEEPIKAVNIDKVNTEADETDPYAVPDGVSLYYVSNKNGTFALHLSRRTGLNQAWPGGKGIFAPPGADVRTPFFYKEFLYFATDQVPDEKLAKLRNFDMYRKLDQGAPIPLLGVSEKDSEMRPWITPTGAEFYFSRQVMDRWQVMVAVGPNPGPIGKAKEAGLPADFAHPTLSASGLTMFVQGPLEEGRLGIFRTTRPRVGGAWAAPKPLTRLNHPEAKRGDMAPCLSADGTRLYFASDRPGGKGGLDLWTVPTALLK